MQLIMKPNGSPAIMNQKRVLQRSVTHVPDDCDCGVLRVFVRDVRGQGAVN